MSETVVSETVASEAIVAVVDLTKRIGTTAALDGLSLEVRPGCVTGLVGPDGAGKTTLMRLLAGLLRADSGTARVLGADPGREPSRVQAGIGYMPQRFGLYEDLTVAENFAFYADLQGVAAAEKRRRFDELTAFTGLGPFTTRLAGRLSGGMKQKLGLACTLVHRPRLLLLDEPSVGVDPVSRRELWEMVYRLVADGVSVLWSTAYLDEAERCEDVVLLHRGRLLDAGPPARFTRMVEGRTFALRLDPASKWRALRWLRGRSEAADATVRGGGLHVVLAEGQTAQALRGALSREAGIDVELEPVRPVFEDAFIALMERSRAPAQAPPPEGEAMPAPAAARGAEAVIEVRGLTRRFGAFVAVDGVGFTVSRGEIFGLLGPNGAGKSTTFRMLLGLLAPSGGEARVLGIDLRRAAAVARGRCGYMAQHFSLYGNMTVAQNLRFYAQAYGLRPGARRRRIDWALEAFDLGRYAEADADALPFGFRQRLALAAALLHEPGVLFLDEPTSGVDPLVRRSFWDRITAIAAGGVTVLVTTHFMDEAEYCDRLGVIYRGRLIAEGAPDHIKAERATPDLPEPTLEDAFVSLIEEHERERAA